MKEIGSLNLVLFACLLGCFTSFLYLYTGRSFLVSAVWLFANVNNFLFVEKEVRKEIKAPERESLPHLMFKEIGLSEA